MLECWRGAILFARHRAPVESPAGASAPSEPNMAAPSHHAAGTDGQITRATSNNSKCERTQPDPTHAGGCAGPPTPYRDKQCAGLNELRREDHQDSRPEPAVVRHLAWCLRYAGPAQTPFQTRSNSSCEWRSVIQVAGRRIPSTFLPINRWQGTHRIRPILVACRLSRLAARRSFFQQGRRRRSRRMAVCSTATSARWVTGSLKRRVRRQPRRASLPARRHRFQCAAP